MKYKALVPELSVTNISESKKFYLDILGFHLEYERVEDKFAFLSFGEAQLMIEEINGSWNTAELMYPLGRGVNFQIDMDDVEGMAAALKRHEISLFRDVMVNHYESDDGVVMVKEILVQDPDGYLLRFSQLITAGSSI
ncbi:bleomycin resistance protein [Peribacillus muralis]|uniref:bleomycin resistance protein n=1 Tax=Peribacillus muralis TaxID=264697 RepID=UPI00070E78E6|nr:VOC family protein [Peribacillus muralis]MCK1995543.1 VOC family protein [Peribacillus muralis]MCK2015447.1 VOC family protein [Peribacillus muralis]